MPDRRSKPRPARGAPAAPTPSQRKAAAEKVARRADRPARVVGRATARAEGQRIGREKVISSARWRTPLIIDIVAGTVVFLIGVVLAVDWSPVGGGGLGALGGLYAALAARRWRLWADLRRARASGADGDQGVQ